MAMMSTASATSATHRLCIAKSCAGNPSSQVAARSRWRIVSGLGTSGVEGFLLASCSGLAAGFAGSCVVSLSMSSGIEGFSTRDGLAGTIVRVVSGKRGSSRVCSSATSDIVEAMLLLVLVVSKVPHIASISVSAGTSSWESRRSGAEVIDYMDVVDWAMRR